MRILLSFATALLAISVGGNNAFALSVSKAHVAYAADTAVKVNGRSHRRHRYSGGAPYANWCAYNCYAVRPGTVGPLGAYHYSEYYYDQDLPFRYRWDWDASPSDNVLARIHPYTGEPFLRLLERPY
jgi:hypothetical protein